MNEIDSLNILREELYSKDLYEFFYNVLNRLINDDDFFNDVCIYSDYYLESIIVKEFNELNLGYVIDIYSIPQSISECIDDEPTKYILTICDVNSRKIKTGVFEEGWIYYD